MKNKNIASKTTGFQRFVFAVVVMLNVILISGSFLLYALYASAYKESLWKGNLGNISNLNNSAAVNATSLFNSWSIKLNDIAQYAEHHEMTYEEALNFISETNSNESRFFQLIGSDYKGHSAKKNSDGTFTEVSYENYSSSLLKAFNDVDDDDYGGGICFTPEFTDNGETAVKFFAIYKHVELKNENGIKEKYTLLLASKSKDVLVVFNNREDFKGQSCVLIDENGNYIVSNNDFKSTNFFQYLYVYNDLTLDEKNEIIDTMERNESGELFYKNAGAVVEDCVYRYQKIPDSSWYCITCVPVSSFRTPEFNSNYVVYAVIMIMVLLVVDVSWLQITNSRLRVSISREIEANSAKGTFMSRMSHEIRSPLNAVIGYNTIARNEIAEAKTDAEHRQAEMKVMDCLTKSSVASKHLLTIINDVLDMSAIESGKIKVAHERFDFKGLISSLTTIFYSQAKSKGVELEVVFDSLTEEWFVGDQMRTNQIITNLLSNAVKFTPDGGKVRLTISQPEAETNASHIHFEVSDTGIGMSKEYLEHIWSPFEQADSSISRRFGGTGLGLSITKNLVDLMGGTIRVESTLGAGTTFYVELTFERTEQPENSEAYDFSSINALVVDDDLYTCDYIKQLFNRCGARCSSVTSGESAIETFSIAEKTGEPFTLCLVDWRMPQMDGIETIKRLRSIAGEHLPIIVITAYDFSEVSEKAAEAGVKMFITKPLFQSSLFDLLANISGNRSVKKIQKKQTFDFDGARVLLAEDNTMNMEIAKRILESAGLVIESAWNGEEAVNKFVSSEPGTYTAILMDIHMPVMDGHEATRTIRASSHPEAKVIPIIAMTADAFAENVSEAYAAGMNDHISKPIDVQSLFETLKKHICDKK